MIPDATARRVALGLAAAILLSGCGGADEPTATIAGGAPPSDVCGEMLRPTLQEGSHLIGDTEPPVPYTSNPPSSGWHKSGAPVRGVVDVQLTGPEFVSALESGDVVVAWDPDRVPPATVDRIEELARTTFEDRLTTSPWAGGQAPITLVGWGVLRGCTDLDEAALTAFVLAWYGASSAH